MYNAKEGRSVNQPLNHDGINYDHWKARMVTFLKSMDKKTWKEVINGRSPPKITVDNNGTLNHEKDWSKEKDKITLGNSRALNALQWS